MLIETNDRDFDRDVIEASRSLPVLVDFWAPWCGPCRIIGPILEKLAAATDRWQLVKVNTEQCLGLAQRFHIRSIPAVKLFADGRVVGELVGALPEREILAWLEERIPSEARRMLEAAQAARRSGREQEAVEQLEAILGAEPDDPGARVELAEILLVRDEQRALELVAGLELDPDVGARAEGVATLAGLRARLDTPAEGDAWVLYRQGIRAWLDGEYAHAAEAWIETVKRDRGIDADGGRRACVALFRWLGDEHAVTRRFRSQFASALF